MEKLTLTPAELGPADADAARRAGVSDEDLREAIYVAALFCVIDRVADALGFAVPTGADLARTAKFLLRAGYR